MQRERSAFVSELPELAYAANGSSFYPKEDYWRPWDISGPRALDFSSLRATSTSTFVDSAKRVFLWHLETQSVAGPASRFGDLLHILRLLDDERPRLYKRNTIEPAEVLRARTLLGLSNEYRLLHLRPILVRWSEMGYIGIPDETAQTLQNLKLKGNEKGEAVLTMDPTRGPFIEAELQAIHRAANRAFACGELSLRMFSMLWIYFSVGARPSQVALLKLGDLKVQKAGKEILSYHLDVPRVKQRGGQIRRTSFRSRPLLPDIGKIIKAQCMAVARQYGKLHEPASFEEQQLPMFPNWQATGPESLRFHSFADQISKEFVKALNSLQVRSCRTGKPMEFSVYRFRRTLGTRAAQEGLNEYSIAELLDHSTTQGAAIYVKTVPRILENIEKAVALDWAPLVAAFNGVIIDNETEATRFPDPSCRIGAPEYSGDCGCCGHDGSCNVLAPLGCYVCPHFQALADGPHEQVLEWLLRRREEVSHRTNDARIASVNDELIFAVAGVVDECRKIKKGPKDGADDG